MWNAWGRSDPRSKNKNYKAKALLWKEVPQSQIITWEFNLMIKKVRTYCRNGLTATLPWLILPAELRSYKYKETKSKLQRHIGLQGTIANGHENSGIASHCNDWIKCCELKSISTFFFGGRINIHCWSVYLPVTWFIFPSPFISPSTIFKICSDL